MDLRVSSVHVLSSLTTTFVSLHSTRTDDGPGLAWPIRLAFSALKPAWAGSALPLAVADFLRLRSARGALDTTQHRPSQISLGPVLFMCARNPGSTGAWITRAPFYRLRHITYNT